MNDKSFTNIQEEHIYTHNEIEKVELLDEEINAFFKELDKRKRNDLYENGLQACIVIFPDKCAMKICEGDGMAPHMNVFINLVKYLNNDPNYISVFGTSFFINFAKENRQLNENGIQIRIIDSEQILMLAITSMIDINSQYQISVLNKIIDICKA